MNDANPSKDPRAANAETHGLFTNPENMEVDERQRYNDFMEELVTTIAPNGFEEEMIAQRIADSTWRIQRISALEEELEEEDWETRSRILSRFSLYESRLHRNIIQLYKLLDQRRAQAEKTNSLAKSAKNEEVMPQRPLRRAWEFRPPRSKRYEEQHAPVYLCLKSDDDKDHECEYLDSEELLAEQSARRAEEEPQE